MRPKIKLQNKIKIEEQNQSFKTITNINNH